MNAVHRVVRPRLTIYVCQESQQTREQQVKHENGDATANTFFGEYMFVATIHGWNFKFRTGGLRIEQLGGIVRLITKSQYHCIINIKNWNKKCICNLSTPQMHTKRRTYLQIRSHCFGMSLYCMPVSSV